MLGQGLNRRQFIFRTALASFGFGGVLSGRTWAGPGGSCHLDGIKVIDVHAHPHELFRSYSKNRPDTPTVDLISRSGLTACGFAAVGDYTIICNNRLGPPYDHTMTQMAKVKKWAERGYVDLVLKGADLDRRPPQGSWIRAYPGLDAYRIHRLRRSLGRARRAQQVVPPGPPGADLAQ